MLRAFIVDDEPLLVEDIRGRLERHFKGEVQVVGVATTLEEAQKRIDRLCPNLLFLDVHLDQGTAFDLLEALEHDAFEIIFVTAYDNNAIRAIKVGALDYILKPIDDDEFHVAVQKVLTLENPKGPVKDLGPVADAFFNRREIKKLVFKTVDDVFILDKDAILYCESEGNYSTIHTLEQNKIMVSKNLKKLEEELPAETFIRCHQSYIVNKTHVRKYSNRGFLELVNNSKVPVSVRKREETLKQLFGA
ncbi:MAG TPA: LytTR family DNA-binding domain-containing protein [Flavobacteriaceae bacterium]|nr:response regulator transcription factor [Flavobacteriaceae bacterium]MCB9212061.1 response regulator transcription factor [Alteromonas sp.]HPF09844.1 LytTR family DNA-binding domain-containing protein [Flavobacteriaceae bacterium]HQU22047.1 LytTR family DNA-binding domain-containing protein [Flavobacteriaceae bacterium]HQU64072.1 LytTR family DNA-binding domain-containing protein [Flavobacteriaceae bacterium]